MQHGLIDVYRLMLYPLALASGKRFFRAGGNKTTLSLADAKTTSTSVVTLRAPQSRSPSQPLRGYPMEASSIPII
jgi:dihydrofolate reductase